MKSLLFATVATLGLLAAPVSFAQIPPSTAEQNLANDMAAAEAAVRHERDSIVAYVQDRVKNDAVMNDYWWRCIHDTACDAGWKDVPEKPAVTSAAPTAPKQP
jgi:hypothetical protein